LFFFRLLSRLPFFLLYALSDVLFVLIFYVFRYRRKVVLENLQRAFPEKTRSEILAIRRQFFRNLADIIVESLKTLTISPEELRRRIQLYDFDLLNDYLKNGQPVVVMTAHQGNWEWLLVRGSLEVITEIDAVFKELSQPLFNRLMQQIRGRFPATHLSEMQKLPRELISRRSVPRAIALVADQTPQPQHAYWTEFLHRQTPFFVGGAKIAFSQNYPVLFMDMKRIRRGFYEIRTFPVANPPYTGRKPEDILENYVRRIETSIIRQPADWLWSHKRWKHKAP
jgi:Kdo2-lipid IVA lauroyltransferase/acyltransferase